MNRKLTNYPSDAKAKELLNEADFSDFVPASVTEKTTKNLKARRSVSSS